MYTSIEEGNTHAHTFEKKKYALKYLQRYNVTRRRRRRFTVSNQSHHSTFTQIRARTRLMVCTPHTTKCRRGSVVLL